MFNKMIHRLYSSLLFPTFFKIITDDTGGIKRQVSIPADRVSVVDDVEVDRISYQASDAASDRGERVKKK